MKKVTFYVTDKYYAKITEALPRLNEYISGMDRGTEIGSPEWEQELEDCGAFGVLMWLFEQSNVEDI